jgi:multidrug efflux pump subunit AcrB
MRTMNEKDNLLSKLSLSFIKKYRASILIWILILVFGLFSYTTLLKREGFPEITVPIGLITGAYFVDDATTVEEDISLPISDALLDQSFISSVTTSSSENTFQIIAFFDDETNSAEGIRLSSQVIDQLELPEQALIETQVIDAGKIDGFNEFIVSIYSKNGSTREELEEQAQDFASKLSTKPEVDSVEVLSSTQELTNPLNGGLETRQTSFSAVSLPDESSGQLQFFNSINIGVNGTIDVDTISLDTALSEFIEQYNSESSDSQAIIAAGLADSINNQLASLQNNVLMAVIIVLIITALFISWKTAVLSGVFILSVIAAVLATLYMIGYSLNTISLFALVLTLGLFVDDATIIVEALDSNSNKKDSPTSIVRHSIKRVGAASLAGTLTTILVFTPMLFVGGILGDFIRILPITVIISLSISIFLSIVLIPLLSRPFLKNLPDSRLPSLNKPIDFIANLLSKAPVYLFSKKSGKIIVSAILIFSFSVIAAGLFVGSKVDVNVFPDSEDSDSLLVRGAFTTPTDIEGATDRTNELNQAINDAAGEYIERITYFQGTNRDFTAQIILTSFRDRETKAPEIIDSIEDQSRQIDGVSVSVSQLDAGPPAEEFPFRAQIYSSDRQDATLFANEMIGYLENDETRNKLNINDARIAGQGALRTKDSQKFIEVEASCQDCLVTNFVQQTQESVESDVLPDVANFNLSEDAVEFDFGQESENISSFESTIVALFVAIALIYILLVLQFDSFTQPLLIILAIPFSLIGVFGALYLTDTPVSFFVMIGLIGLAGIVVNNSILMVDYANQEKRAGHNNIEAASNALKLRFRALVTTTTTTFLALIPLALTDPFWKPLVYVIIFGLVASTILIVITFPYLYIILENLRDKVHKNSTD